MTLPRRKLPRLHGFDYSLPNYYFVTICTADKKCLFGEPQELGYLGKLVEQELVNIPSHYPNVWIDKYVIMPNHIHAIIVLENMPEGSASLSTVVGQFKAGVSRKVHGHQPGMVLWQKSFYDTVIRSEAAYRQIWNYIEGNPSKWQEDELYQQPR